MNKLPIEPNINEGPSFMFSLKDNLRSIAKAFNNVAIWIDDVATWFVSGVLAITHGGTGATTAAGARTNLGLGNVDNTSDANKPVSTAQAAADALRVLKSGDTMTGNLTFSAGSPLTVPGNGYAFNGYATGSGPVYFQTGLVGNPNWELCYTQFFHQPGVWAGYRIVIGTTATKVFEFTNNGDFKAPTAVYAAGVILTSDSRTKEDIEPITGALDKVDAIGGSLWTRPRVDDGMGQLEGPVLNETFAGVVADDVAIAFPEGMKFSPTNDMPDRMGVDAGALIGLLMAAVKELRAEVAALKIIT